MRGTAEHHFRVVTDPTWRSVLSTELSMPSSSSAPKAAPARFHCPFRRGVQPRPRPHRRCVEYLRTDSLRRCDNNVVFDSNADSPECFRDSEVIHLEVQSRFDCEHHSLVHDAVLVKLFPRLRTVVDVEPEVVRGSVDHVATVMLSRFRERFVERHGQEAPFRNMACNNCHGWACTSRNMIPGFTTANAASAASHGLIDESLSLGESAVDGEGSRDVRGVQALHFDTGVHKHKITIADRSIVSHPVQNAGVGTSGGDSFVADMISLGTRASVERALDEALAVRGRLPRDIVPRTSSNPVAVADCEPNLGNFERVFDQSLFALEYGQFVVSSSDVASSTVDPLGNCRIGFATITSTAASALSRTSERSARDRVASPNSTATASGVGRGPTQNSPMSASE